MKPVALLRAAGAAGLSISIAPSGSLYVAPAERLTPELRALLVEHKPELIEFLRDAQRTVADLMAAAMFACDHHGDGAEAREAMRQDVMNTPEHLRADLLAHFRQTYGVSR